MPKVIISDNAVNFRGFAPILGELQNHPKVVELLQHYRTQWKFIPARAPWFGGVYERMIGITKSVLKRVLGNALVTIDELATIVVEVEARINNRPITYIDSEEDIEALTPSHLLYGKTIDTLPSIIDEDELDDDHIYDETTLTRRHKKILNLINVAWVKWRNEYLLALRERDRQAIPGSKSGMATPREGDVVLLIPDQKYAPSQLGRIMEILPGKDGHERVVRLKTKGGETIRPIARLAKLESSVDESNDLKVKVEKIVCDSDQSQTSTRPPTRKAAVIARRKLKELCDADAM